MTFSSNRPVVTWDPESSAWVASRDISAQAAAPITPSEDIRDRVVRELTRHRRVATGMAVWLCSCGHEGDETPEAHLADVLYDAGLLMDEP